MKTFTTIILLLISFVSFSQEGFQLIIIDNINRADTVIFGMDNDATQGIDETFGEQNIFGTAPDSLEIRSVMRDTVNHLCLTKSFNELNGEPLYFDSNIDLKRDFRELTLLSPENNNFEFLINAVEYPVTIIADFTKWYPNGIWIVHLFLVDNNCQNVNNTDYTYVNLDDVDTLIIDNDASVKGIIVKFEHEVGINERTKNISLEISPNPTTGLFLLNVNNKKYDNAELIIYSSTGRIIEKKELNKPSDYNIDISDYQNGLYLIQYKDGLGHISTKKVIKK